MNLASTEVASDQFKALLLVAANLDQQMGNIWISAKAVGECLKEIWPVLFTDQLLPFFLGQGCVHRVGAI